MKTYGLSIIVCILMSGSLAASSASTGRGSCSPSRIDMAIDKDQEEIYYELKRSFEGLPTPDVTRGISKLVDVWDQQIRDNDFDSALADCPLPIMQELLKHPRISPKSALGLHIHRIFFSHQDFAAIKSLARHKNFALGYIRPEHEEGRPKYSSAVYECVSNPDIVAFLSYMGAPVLNFSGEVGGDPIAKAQRKIAEHQDNNPTRYKKWQRTLAILEAPKDTLHTYMTAEQRKEYDTIKKEREVGEYTRRGSFFKPAQSED